MHCGPPPFRYGILLIGSLCLSILACNYALINFTFICMTQDANDTIEIDGTRRQRYDYTPTEKSYIIWAVAIGTILGTFPINFLCVRYGARWPFFLCGMLSAVSTGLSPLAAHSNLWLFVALRFLQGVAYASDFAAIGVLVVRWSPLAEVAIFISVLTCYSSISSIVTNPVAGAFCTSSLGWRWSFYCFSIATVVLFTLWLVVYSDDPRRHRSVRGDELKRINEGKTREHIERDKFVPYRASSEISYTSVDMLYTIVETFAEPSKKICTSRVIIVVWLNAFAELIGYVVMLTYGPIFINKMLGFSISHTSYLSVIGAVLHAGLKLTCGLISDKLTIVSERTKMLMFNTLAVTVSGVFCILVGFMSSPIMAIVFMTISELLSGLNPGGFYKCASLHARQHAHFVLSMIQFSKCVALIVGPLTVAIFTNSDSDKHGWQLVFGLNGVLMIIASILFFFTATSEPADFTTQRKGERKGDENEMEENSQAESNTTLNRNH